MTEVSDPTNNFPRFVFVFGASDKFISSLMDVLPEALAMDLADTITIVENDLRLDPNTLVPVLRKGFSPDVLGTVALNIYRNDLGGDVNDEQVIIYGPLEPQDLAPISRVYGLQECLCVWLPGTVVNPVFTTEAASDEFKLHPIITLMETEISKQIEELKLEWALRTAPKESVA